jgi:Etoposide-induced protein 2.4 (EI24)
VRPVVDAFWRALASMAHPAVWVRSLGTVVLAATAVLAAGWFGWEDALVAVREVITEGELGVPMRHWLESFGAGELQAALAPLIVVSLAGPLVALASLLLVAVVLGDGPVRWVAARRLPPLSAAASRGAWRARLWRSIAWGVVAVMVLLVTLPLWLVPPLAVLLPAVAWAWLAGRLLGVDMLTDLAVPEECDRLAHEHGGALRSIGVASGLLCAAPSVLWWQGGVPALVAAPLLMGAAVVYETLVGIFAALWFAHFTLGRLQAQRSRATIDAPAASAASNPATPP